MRGVLASSMFRQNTGGYKGVREVFFWDVFVWASHSPQAFNSFTCERMWGLMYLYVHLCPLQKCTNFHTLHLPPHVLLKSWLCTIHNINTHTFKRQHPLQPQPVHPTPVSQRYRSILKGTPKVLPKGCTGMIKDQYCGCVDTQFNCEAMDWKKCHLVVTLNVFHSIDVLSFKIHLLGFLCFCCVFCPFFPMFCLTIYCIYCQALRVTHFTFYKNFTAPMIWILSLATLQFQ